MPRHKLNTQFTWRQPDGPYQLISQAQADAYRTQGGFVLPDAFSAEEVSLLLDDLDRIESLTNAQLKSQPAHVPSIARHDQIVFHPHLVTRSATARSFARHPVLQALCRDLLGEAARLYWDQLVYKRPQTLDEFPWHQDNGYTFVQPQQYLTCWVALTDATLENGCPWIAPGWHQQGTLAHQWTKLGFRCFEAEPEEITALPVSAGSIAVFSSLTPHRTGPNHTDVTRKAYILQYAPDGARVYPQDGEAYLANDPDKQFLVT